MALKTTPLNSVHHEQGGRMIEFAGWEMPIQYHGALKEHLAVRQRVGIFDVSHMGELEIRGPDALDLVQRLTTNNVARLHEGQAQYSAFLYPSGTFVDDVVVYCLGSQHFLICVNASNTQKDLQWVLQQAKGQVTIEDRSFDYAQIAVQGPQSEEVLQELTSNSLSLIPFYHFEIGQVAGIEAIISRTGYTGELGFELYVDSVEAETLWRRLFEVGQAVGMVPAGLAARNTLRLEMKFALYGNDIDESTTPLEAGLARIVKLGKGDFIGRHALSEQKRQGLRQKLIGFRMRGRGIARDEYPIRIGGKRVAKVTSGSFGPSVQHGIGLAYLPTEFAVIGQQLEIEIRGKTVPAEVTRTPFYARRRD